MRAITTAAAIGAIVLSGAGTPRAESARAGAGAVTVTAEIVGGSAYQGHDLSLRLTFRNGAEPVVEIPAEAFARDAFTIRDSRGRAPKEGAAAGAAPAPLVLDGYATVARDVSLSSWYPKLTSRRGEWSVLWSHGPWRLDPFAVKIIQPHEPRKDRYAIVETDLGTMKWELLSDIAPNHVRRFVDLSRAGFYDGLTVFRVTPGGTAEGGDPKGDGTGAWDRLLHPEIAPDLTVGMGMVGAARQETSMTSDSMFFITLAPAAYMAGKHTFYARIVDGIEWVGKIQAAENFGNTGLRNANMLVRPVRILRVRIR